MLEALAILRCVSLCRKVEFQSSGHAMRVRYFRASARRLRSERMNWLSSSTPKKRATHRELEYKELGGIVVWGEKSAERLGFDIV